MTLTTHRSPAARALHAALDLADRLRRALRPQPQRRAQALYVLDDATLRDSGIVHAEFETFAAEARRQVPRTLPHAVAVNAA